MQIKFYGQRRQFENLTIIPSPMGLRDGLGGEIVELGCESGEGGYHTDPFLASANRAAHILQNIQKRAGAEIMETVLTLLSVTEVANQ
ncbi:hypothetical protein QE152_g23472 [Popillia japonica]|uniref:Uncharacterized protein n=1 Tax=Popillia japonica TaxID=7064 RepID=A0AAW1KGX0_POPJA